MRLLYLQTNLYVFKFVQVFWKSLQSFAFNRERFNELFHMKFKVPIQSVGILNICTLWILQRNIVVYPWVEVTSVNFNSKKAYEDEIFSRQDVLQFFSGES